MSEDAAHCATNTPGAAQSATAAVDQVILLLKSRDDTSKFVGLAVLKTILDNQQELRRDPVIITRCWNAISPRFLDRLLRARESERKAKEEARNMVDLAAGVIHTFTVLLPPEAENEEKLLGRCEGLLAALVRSSSETATLILQTLLSFASGRNGAERLLGVEDWSPLVEIAPQQHLAVDVLRFAFINGAARPDLLPVRLRLDKAVPVLITSFRDSPASPLLELLADLFTKLPPEAIPTVPTWLRPLSLLIQRTFLARPTFAARKSGTILCSALLQFYPEKFPALLFWSPSKGKRPATTESELKPFAYLFINLVLIDIRASFPSLLELLASPDYSSTAERLAAGFDVVATFVGFLLKSLDEETSGGDAGRIFLQIEPDLLLKLRRDIAETMGSTIEFLRDRWDGAAMRVHENSKTLPVNQRTPLGLTWDTREGGIAQDHLTLAAIRTLALWLREDEGETLRREASGIMDVFLGLYNLSNRNLAPGTGLEDIKSMDFRPALLTALEGILTTDSGVETFQETDGWRILWQHDLSKLLSSGVTRSRGDTSRGIEIIRALLTIVEHGNSEKESFREEWTDVFAAAAALSSSSGSDADSLSLELMLSLFQLATEILSRAPTRLRRRFAKEAKVVAERARVMIVGTEEELRDGAVEVLEGLEGLGIGV